MHKKNTNVKRYPIVMAILDFNCQVRNKMHNKLILFLVFNATFGNISAISWRPALVVEEAGVPGENHQPWASNW
jgi:hypothetical protein